MTREQAVSELKLVSYGTWASILNISTYNELDEAINSILTSLTDELVRECSTVIDLLIVATKLHNELQ